MNTCKTCRFWERIHFGELHHLGRCSSDKLTETLSFEETPPDGLDCGGLDDPQAVILTVGEDFGCIHWEGNVNA